VSRFALALLAVLALGCERDPKPGVAEVARSEVELELDLGAIRVSIVDGLEAAVQDPGIAQQLGPAARLESPEVVAAIERLLARVIADPELVRIADEFFLALQDSPAMRATLLEHARQHPELVDSDLSTLRETFVADVERRLTREALAELLEKQLRVAVRESDTMLAKAWVSEAGGASALAGRVLARIEDPEFRAQLSTLLGRDNLQAVLVRRFADPTRAARLLLGLAPTPPSQETLVQILDHERTAQLLAAALGRALQTKQVRTQCEELFALALAAELDAPAFTQALASLLDDPTLRSEATTFTSAVAREAFSRRAVSAEVARLSELDALLLQTLD
jgi:hypothetical protein